MVKQCWEGWACRATLRILRLQLCPLHPAALGLALGVGQTAEGMQFKCGVGAPHPPGCGLAGRASVVQALAIGRGQLVSVAV